jgi:CheY-like chemotaxis protein
MYKAAVILLIEDDTADQKLTRQSLAKDKIGNDLRAVSSGEEALEYLENSKQGRPEFPLPDLILLDLNMPGMGGKELLKKLKADSVLKTIPVVVLTTSDSDKDVLDTFQLQAAGYIRKPPTLEGFEQVMQELTDYWFIICRRVQHSRTDTRVQVGVS